MEAGVCGASGTRSLLICGGSLLAAAAILIWIWSKKQEAEAMGLESCTDEEEEDSEMLFVPSSDGLQKEGKLRSKLGSGPAAAYKRGRVEQEDRRNG